MMRALFCLWLAVTPCVAAEPASGLASGTVVTVRLRTGEKIRGRLEAVTAESIEVLTAKADRIETRTIPIREIKSVRPVSNGCRDALAAVGGMVLIFTGMGLVLAIAGNARH